MRNVLKIFTGGLTALAGFVVLVPSGVAAAPSVPPGSSSSTDSRR